MEPHDDGQDTSPCNCPDRTKDSSILYSLLASSPESSSAGDVTHGGHDRCPMVHHMVNNVWRRSCSSPTSATNNNNNSTSSSPTANASLPVSQPTMQQFPPAIVILRHPEDAYQQAAQLLLKTVDFARNLPAMQRLCPRDRVTLLQHCWAELLVLTMAQYRFEFETDELELFPSSSNTHRGHHHQHHDDQNAPASPSPCSCPHGNDAESVLVKCLVALRGIPTKSDVHMINSFFGKCDLLQLDDKEYCHLKATILFNPGRVTFENFNCPNSQKRTYFSPGLNLDYM